MYPPLTPTNTAMKLTAHFVLFLQSEEVEWDYAPTGGNVCSGAKTPFDEAALVFLGKSPNRIGPVNTKAMYVEYSDASFKKQVVSPTFT